MKIVLEKVIKGLEAITKKFKDAYVETYGDKDLAKEFNERLEIIKDYNKQRFIGEMAVRYAKQQKEDGFLVTPELAFMEGTRMFCKAKIAGDLDELNCLKGEENE